MKLYRYIYLCLLVSIRVQSLTQPVASKLYYIENDEANKPAILALYQNSQGLILCGTTKGLYRFDGFDFTLYPQQGNVTSAVTAIYETKEKITWIGFGNGDIGELVNNKIRLLSIAEGFPKKSVKSIIQDTSGVVWIGTAGEGIYYYKNNRLYNINEDDGLSDNYVYKLLFLPKLGVVAATDRGINICTLQHDKKHIITYTSKNGLPDNIVRSIYAPDNECLWLGMQDAGIKAYNNDFRDNSRLKVDWKFGQVNDIVASATKVFAATEDSALVIYNHDKNNILYKKFYIDHTIQKISCLLKDREGNIWAAGNNELLRTAKVGMEQIYKLSEIEAENIHCLHYSSDSALWFNNADGLTRLHKESGEWLSEKFHLSNFNNTAITAVYEDLDDNLWIGSLGKGITIFNHETKNQQLLKDHSLLNSNIISITGKGNLIWISGLEGIVQATINGNKTKYINYNDTSIGNKYVYNIFTDKQNRVWFATDGDGITMLNNGKFFQLKNQPEYIGSVVYKILQDAFGNIWYSTYDKGIVKYDGKTFTGFSTDQGLSDAGISGFLNANDFLAVIHKNSIDIVDPVSGKISYIDKSRNAIDINTDLNACTNDNAGNIYFISDECIYSYNLSKQTIWQPAVSIDKINLFGNDAEVSNGHAFRYNENNLSFYYTGIYYSQSEKILYQYKLDGYDKEWVNTKDRFRNFPNLPAGNYTFRVRVSLNKNFKNAPETAFSFVISTPFWLQTWFIIISAIVFSLVLYLFIKLREKRITKLNILKTEKIQSQLETLRSEVNPHFLFNSFNILIAEIESRPDKAVTYAEKLSDFYRSLVTHRDKDLIPLADELHILNDYTFLQQKRFSSGLDIDIKINPQTIASTYIPPLVLQMIVENAIKHNIVSKEYPLCIKIEEADKNYLAVTNNINTKSEPEKSSGLGLQNIQKRYALLNLPPAIIESDDECFTVKISLLKK